MASDIRFLRAFRAGDALLDYDVVVLNSVLDSHEHLLSALKSSFEWMAVVNPTLTDGSPFKRDRVAIEAAISKGDSHNA